jgi:hypothetical protein
LATSTTYFPTDLADTCPALLNTERIKQGTTRVLGRSIVDEQGRYRRGRTPRTSFRLASPYAPGLAPLF